MKRIKPKNGFTLIEALLALAVVSVLVLGTGQVLIHALAVKKAVDEQAEACSLAASKLERFKAAGFESPELSEGGAAEEVAGESVAAVFIREWSVECISEALKKVEIIAYSLARPGRKVRLALYLARELEF